MCNLGAAISQKEGTRVADMMGTALIRRHIGRTFEVMRLRKGLTQDQAGEALDRSRGTISRIEAGDESVRFRELDVRAMLDLYEATDQERQQQLALTAETRNGKRKSWWHDYTKTDLPERMRLFYVLEDAADTIRQYEPELVPGLLQTQQYAWQMMTSPAGYATDEEAQRRVQLRLDRQSVLTRPRAPQLDVVLNEAVIRRPIGGQEVMAEQIQHLLQLTQRGNITIRIVPFSIGVHAGAVASSFSLMDFPDAPHGEPLELPVVFVDTLTGAMYLNKSDEVDAYRLIWHDLLEQALTPKESEELLRDALKGLQND